MILEVTQDHSDLHREVWRFFVSDSLIRLAQYEEQKRASKRHKWAAIRAWARDRGITRYGQRLLASEPDISPSVREQTIAALTSQLRFEKWKR